MNKNTVQLIKINLLVDRIKTDIKNIEAYRGEAYLNDDDIGRAVQDMKVALSTFIHGETVEICPHCETEHEIDKIDDPCPNCGKTLVACSLCTMDYANECSGCPNGTAKNFNLNLDNI